LWKKFPDGDEATKDIGALVTAAKKTKDKPALVAATLAKQKLGNLEQLKAKGNDTKSAEKQLLGLYNDAFELVKAVEDQPTWSVTLGSNFKAELELVQDGAESSKLKSWLAGIKKLGPFEAANAERIKCTPMSGDEFHVYLGKANRVYFTANKKTGSVTLTGVKHR